MQYKTWLFYREFFMKWRSGLAVAANLHTIKNYFVSIIMLYYWLFIFLLHDWGFHCDIFLHLHNMQHRRINQAMRFETPQNILGLWIKRIKQYSAIKMKMGLLSMVSLPAYNSKNTCYALCISHWYKRTWTMISTCRVELC
mgnify:CR=1 FL=1